MKKRAVSTVSLTVLILLLVWLSVLHGIDAVVAAEKTPFQVRAKAAILGDVDSGAILLEQNAEEQYAPASLTKIMTLYLVYEALANGSLTLEETLPVSEAAWRLGGSKTFVKVGDRVRVEDLILGVAVQSGNDACVVLAEHLAGSEAGFADMMNHKARQLGMTRTHFVNATGLPDEDHYTTASDMFRLTGAIVRDFPQYAHFVKQKQYTFNGIRQYNRNRLLWRDASVTGMKTGYTRAAGYCLIATNEQEGQRLIAVIMGSKSSKIREAEALRLLRYGNRMYETVRLFERDAVVKTLRVWKGAVEFVDGVVRQPVLVTIPRTSRGQLGVGLSYETPILAPVAESAVLGKVVVSLGENNTILEQSVVAGKAVEEGGVFSALLDSIRLRFGW